MDFDERLENRSFATVRSIPLMDSDGFDCVVIIARVAFRMSFDGRARLGFRPVRVNTEYDGGTTRFPTDCVVDKPGTDVGLIGTAYPTRAKSGSNNSALAWLQVGEVRKVIQIFGPRTYYRHMGEWMMTDPGPLGPTPLTYDRAFGGRGNDGSECPENPAGRGWEKAELEGKPAPQVAPVHDPLLPGQKPHVGHGTFGPIDTNWEPRATRRGTFDHEHLRNRYPMPPADMDVRCNCWSTPLLYSATPLRGDEACEVGGVLPEGRWRFKLPYYPIRFEYEMDGKPFAPPSHLDGFLIDADERVVELTYRAKVRLPKKWARVDRIRAIAEENLPESALVADEWPLPPEVPAPRSAN